MNLEKIKWINVKSCKHAHLDYLHLEGKNDILIIQFHIVLY